VTLTLYDPATETPDDTASLAEHYVHRLAATGISRLIPNVRTQLLGLRSGYRVFPVTVNNGEIGASYVCEPYSAYILYARRELDLVGIGPSKWLLLPLIGLASLLLRAARINKIVHIDNWMLSTNLHGDWDGEDIGEIRKSLQRQYPDHVIAIRSLDHWSSPGIIEHARGDGWALFPSRQIWVTSDMKAQWQPRHNVAEDLRILRRSDLHIETLPAMALSDAQRIEQLYAMLYLDKYSALNPAFSAQWIMETCQMGLLHYRCARDEDGVIQAVSGSFRRGDVLTPPVVGYDTSKPRALGLYRIASLLFSEDALAHGLKLNGSAGAAEFKRLRGAEPAIEYSAYFIAHLPFVRRMILGGLSVLLNRFAVPYMRKHQL